MIESDAARISVSKTRPSRLGGRPLLCVHPSFPGLGDPDRLIVGEEVPERAIRGLNPTATRGILVGHVAVWLPAGSAGLPESVDEQVLKLVGKMRTKLAQTRSRDAYRVLIVDTWTAHSQFRLSEEAEAKVKRAIFGGHSNVAGVLLVTRDFDEDLKRHRYQMKPLANVVLGGSPIVDLVALDLKQASRARVASFGCASWHKANLEAAQRTMSQVARDEMACAKRTFGTFPH